MSAAAAARKPAEGDARARQVLGRCAPFAALDGEALTDVAKKCALVRIGKRAALYEQGAPAQSLFVLGAGRARLVVGTARGRFVTLGYAGPGQLVGDSALGSDPGYHESAVAGDALEAVRVPLRLVARLVETHGGFAARLMQGLVDRRRRAEQQLSALVTRSVESRLAEFLIEASSTHGIPESRGLLIGVKYTHQEIASVVGATRETVTLALGDLKRRGQVLFDHRRIVLRDVDELRRLV